MNGRIGVVALSVGIALCAVVPSRANVPGSKSVRVDSSPTIEESLSRATPSEETLRTKIAEQGWSPIATFITNGWSVTFQKSEIPPVYGFKEFYWAFAKKMGMEFVYLIGRGDALTPFGPPTITVSKPIPNVIAATYAAP